MPSILTFDVSAEVGIGQPLMQTARIFIPENSTAVRAVLCCLSGASYDWHYWHLEVPGYRGYSFAEHLASHGCVVAAIDHLGTGESSPAGQGVRLQLAHLARGDAAVAQQIRERALAGTLHPELPPLDVPVIGLGHSMGACVTAIAQAETGCYDAVALLGYSPAVDNDVLDLDSAAGDLENRIASITAEVRALNGASPDADVGVLDRNLLKGLFYAADVPESVIAADTAVETCSPIYALAEAVTPGYATPYIEKIDVPVFLGFGDYCIDLSPNPLAEPANYRRARDVTVYVLEGSAHCHNFSTRRMTLWDRIADWLPSVHRSVANQQAMKPRSITTSANIT